MNKIMQFEGRNKSTGESLIANIDIADFANGQQGNLVGSPPMNSLHYQDATYDYYCSAAGGKRASDAAWQIMRIKISDKSTTYAGNTIADYGLPVFTATDVTTVAGHTYNAGVVFP